MKFSAAIQERINRKTLAQHWRWLAISGSVLLVCTLYLFSRDTHTSYSPELGYQELLTNPADVNNCAVPIVLGGSSRLARTLVGNERRYQKMIEDREKIIAKDGGMGLSAFGPKHVLRDLLWDFFIPAFSCPHPMYRVGTLADGGKWACGIERVLHDRPNCLVYSFNHKTPSYSSFEEDILARSPGCQIHAFDPNADTNVTARWPWGDTDTVDKGILKSRVHFNTFSVANPTAENYHSLQSTMRSFGHEWIDILKVDLGGAEFATLLSIIRENQDEPLPFGQLIITINIGLSDDMKTVGHFNDWFTKLECAGLRPYYFEVSMMDVNNRRFEPSIVYWSFMNIRGQHALVDDELPEYP
ncbi:methyltransferase domain-containing protein [Mycena sanguinolenta]|nr:methyltransferase domain-containing protein [Mycena sanguinolenta]